MRDISAKLAAMDLTKTEIAVASLLNEGLSNIEIGRQLFSSEKTIKFHVTSIYKKSKVKKRTEFICLLRGGEITELPRPGSIISTIKESKLTEIRRDLERIKDTLGAISNRLQTLEKWTQ